MHFELKEEQRQLADALRRWIERDYTFDARRAIVRSDTGTSPQAWSTLVELGLTALPIAEAQGGFAGTAADMFVVMQELGRGLVVEPYFATMLGARFLQLAGGQEEMLAQVAAGELKLACALGEPQSRHDLADIVTKASGPLDAAAVSGVKTVVLHGGQADAFIVSARSHGEQRDRDGISLFVVDADTSGLVIHDVRAIDGQRAATITFDHAPATPLGTPGAGWDVLEAAADYGAALLCGEAVGVMDALFAATLDYLKTRQQFGGPIGKFQALQHRMADMFIHLEQARSIALLAAVKADSPDVEERRRVVSAAKARVGEAARFVGQQAVQLHGGIGVTDELPAAHWFKRLTTIGLTLGDTDHHLRRFAAQPGFRDVA
ncbi:alkylation response protein AidB-like acyl-CoA dehydrogenase [Pseudoduganella flava]|uniref:Alkylation response protein AidB-like acyl-CoA dehydrogenase n=1 Tax=Pseudoduganella flava TaxID=871742 RepID=A0A562P9D0_9BURK|nr:acyl-CoA dehydrogenase [Pseudoduganella flava]QGZ42747.1 pimeloyl-CoA dehydrogenase small subunit [Pseudoduganella flava]TWI40999.1 alkylation response protein AidB-like acyl-CoA dehydrogenase [Pseudoduganella flava]